MKTLYLILREGQLTKKTYPVFVAACKELDVVCEPVVINNMTTQLLPTPKPNDMVFRMAVDPAARLMERYMIDSGCTTLYRNPKFAFLDFQNPISHLEATGLPLIPHVHGGTLQKTHLKEIVESLGGFPLIIKIYGGQKGRNVLKIDSWQSFVSINGYLCRSTQPHLIAYQTFIPHSSQGRLIVLGDEVIASMLFSQTTDDFRLNTGGNEKKSKKFPPEIERSVVQATHALGVDFSGTDILFGNDGKFYIAEVNFPCAFPIAQEITEVNIAKAIVSHLLSKES